jgi:hypothetical protein
VPTNNPMMMALQITNLVNSIATEDFQNKIYNGTVHHRELSITMIDLSKLL